MDYSSDFHSGTAGGVMHTLIGDPHQRWPIVGVHQVIVLVCFIPDSIQLYDRNLVCRGTVSLGKNDL